MFTRRKALQLAVVALGGLTSPGITRAMMTGTRGTASDDTAQAHILSNTQRKLAAKLSELIIPTTTTPGALAAGVPQFIDSIVDEWYTDRERRIFIDGLNALDDWCARTYDLNGRHCNEQQLTAALSYAEALTSGYQPPRAPPVGVAPTDEASPFFAKMKELTVVGYFTSEVGIRESLVYDPMPMEYNGDVSVKEVGGQLAQV